jgi:uncharacterized membrane protein (GlpM family)
MHNNCHIRNFEITKYIRKKIKNAHDPISRNNNCYHFGVEQLVPYSVFVSTCYFLITPYVLAYSVFSLTLHNYNFQCS